MIETKKPITEKVLRDAATGAYSCPRPRPTRVFYIAVGDMPPTRAEHFANKIIENFKQGIDDINYENFFVVVREPNSRIEVLSPHSAPLSGPRVREYSIRPTSKWRKLISWFGVQ